jgi:glycosyltransferase involved in cell wall biosynthesis
MRVLVCATEAPLPPVNGFRLMLTALFGELTREHDVRVLAFRSPDQRASLPEEGTHLHLLPQPGDGLGRSVLRASRAMARGQPLRADRLGSQMAEPLRGELRDFAPDVVHVTSGRLAGLGRALAGHPSVLGALDAMHLNTEARALAASGLRRQLLRVEAGRVRRFEAAEYRRFARVTVVSDADRSALLELDPSLEIDVIPNGVDVDFFAPDPEAPVDAGRIVFTGVMSYAPNVLAAEFLAREVFPRVRSRRPDARLTIVGRSPASAVRALGELPGVEVTGEVPDIRSWLRESRVYVCPMTAGTGIKNKLLEAMACGLPCVATPLALQGIRAAPGSEVLVGMDAEELARETTRVLSDDVLAVQLGAAGRAYVRSAHDWSAVARGYLRVWEEVSAATGG